MDLNRQPRATSGIMVRVLLALLPGVTAMTAIWGWGVLWNVLLLSIGCLLCEAGALFLRGAHSWAGQRDHLTDGSALVTAWLIGIALPPFTAPSVLLIAALAAIGLAKHAYGGLGRNLFNPAMVGYAAVMIAFPAQLTDWPALHDTAHDALSGATVLSEFRYRQGLTAAEFFGLRGQPVATSAALAFLAGGALLIYQRIISWRIPAAIAAGVGLCALFGYAQGSSASLGGWWFHMTSGGLMAAALFVATDPVTHPVRPAHQVLFGLLIGMLIYLLRAFGAQPDAIAFAILLGNCCTPLLNRLDLRQVAARHAER